MNRPKDWSSYQQEESPPLAVQYQTLTPAGEAFFAQLEQSRKEITDHILAGFGIHPNLLKPRLEDMTPACPHLQGFLLATAYEAWDAWYPVTRLIFADWLEERGDSRHYKVRGEEGSPALIWPWVYPPGNHNINLTRPVAYYDEETPLLAWEQWSDNRWHELRNYYFLAGQTQASHILPVPIATVYRLRWITPVFSHPSITAHLILDIGLLQPNILNILHGQINPDPVVSRMACRKRVLDLFANEVVVLPADKGNLVGRVLAGNLLPAG